MPSTPPQKSTLFCPACDHQSPVGGDWLVEESDRARRYHCPDCGTEILNQPTAPGSEPPIASVADLAALGTAWRSSLRAWRELLSQGMIPSRR